jgi:hypothetical protein
VSCARFSYPRRKVFAYPPLPSHYHFRHLAKIHLTAGGEWRQPPPVDRE